MFGVAPGVPSLRLGVAIRLPVVGVEAGAVEGPGEDALNSKLGAPAPALFPKDGVGAGEGAGDDALNSKLGPPAPVLLPKEGAGDDALNSKLGLLVLWLFPNVGAGEAAGEDALKSKLGPLVATVFPKMEPELPEPVCVCSAGVG